MPCNMFKSWWTCVIEIHTWFKKCECKVYSKHWTKSQNLKSLHFFMENKYSNDQSHCLVNNSNKYEIHISNIYF